MAVSVMAGCGRDRQSGPETGLEALYRLDRDFISHRGAHTYIEAVGPDSGTSAPNALYSREYSDLMSHFGQYKPVVSPLLELDPAMGCVLDARTWFP